VPPQDFVAKALVLEEPLVILDIVDHGEDAFEIIDALLLFFEVVADLFLLILLDILAFVLLGYLAQVGLI